jgi:hypothetical protein
MGNRVMCVQDAQISDTQKEVYEVSQVTKNICKVDFNITLLARHLRERDIQTGNKVISILEGSAKLYAVQGMMKSDTINLSNYSSHPHCQLFGISCNEIYPDNFSHVFVPKMAIIGGYKPGMYLLNFPLEQKLS